VGLGDFALNPHEKMTSSKKHTEIYKICLNNELFPENSYHLSNNLVKTKPKNKTLTEEIATSSQ
jgi:hypothetical protein